MGNRYLFPFVSITRSLFSGATNKSLGLERIFLGLALFLIVAAEVPLKMSKSTTASPTKSLPGFVVSSKISYIEVSAFG